MPTRAQLSCFTLLLIQSDDKIVVFGYSTTTLLHGMFDTNYVIARYLAH